MWLLLVIFKYATCYIIKPYSFMITSPIKIAIVDDHSLFRETLKTYLSQQNNLYISIQTGNAIDLFDELKRKSDVDVLLMDVFLPELNGYEALKIMKGQYPNIKSIVLSMNSDLNLINDLLDIGIQAYISKADEPASLVQAINAVSENKVYRSRLFTEALYFNRVANSGKNGPKNTISFDDREKRVLQLLWDEKSNKEIANEIFLSVRSVEKLRQDMKEKVGVKSTIGLLKYALIHNIVELERSYRSLSLY